MGGRSRRMDLRAIARAWLPVGPGDRSGARARSPRCPSWWPSRRWPSSPWRDDPATSGGASIAWICLLPVAVGPRAWGSLPDPAVADPGACDDLLVAPVVRRVVQAALVLGTIALLATRMGGRRSLGIVFPPDRRVTLLAAPDPAPGPDLPGRGPAPRGTVLRRGAPGPPVASGAAPGRHPRRGERHSGGDRLSRGRPALGSRRARPRRRDRGPGPDLRVRPPGSRRPRRRAAHPGRGRGGRSRSPASSPTGRGRSCSRSRPTLPSTSPWPWRSPAGSPEAGPEVPSARAGSPLPPVPVAPATLDARRTCTGFWAPGAAVRSLEGERHEGRGRDDPQRRRRAPRDAAQGRGRADGRPGDQRGPGRRRRRGGPRGRVRGRLRHQGARREWPAATRLLARIFGDVAQGTQAELAKIEATTAGEAMTSPALTVEATDTLQSAAEQMAEPQGQPAPGRRRRAGWSGS